LTNNLTDATPESTGESVTRKAGRGIVWNFLTYGLGKGGTLVTTAILARLLTKDDFGLVSVAVIAINYLSVFKDLGLGVALIQRRNDVDRAANTVFTINIILGFLLSIITYLCSPWVAQYFNDPLVTPVLRWLGLSFAINAFGSVHVIWLMRELDYRRKFIPDMGNTLVKSIASIGFAVAGFGVWALVFGQLLGTFVSVLLAWVVVSWRPKLMIDKEVAGSLMKFGSSVVAGDILSVFSDNIDYTIAGKLFGLAQLSIYTLAFRLPEMLLVGNLWVMGGVIFPAFSSIQDKPDEMRRGFLTSVRIIQIIAVPISLGLFVAADPIVKVVFGEQWLDVIPLLRVLAIYSWVYSIGYHIGDIYKAVGRPDILFKLTILNLMVVVPTLLIGSRFGLIGIAWGQLIAVLIRRTISLTVATRFINISIFTILNELKSSVVGGLVLVISAFFALLLTVNIAPFAQLVVVVLAGAIGYLVVLWFLERENLSHLLRKVGVPL